MLCSTPCGKQHPGALPHPLPSSHRCLHQKVARETGTASLSAQPLSPNLQRTLKQFLWKWHLQILAYQVPCHLQSFKAVLIKHAAVLDQLCNHKQAISQWSTGTDVICCCQHWSKYKKAALDPSDPHWVLAGSLLHDLLPADLAVIAEGSLLNKVFPSKNDYQTTLKLGLHHWTKLNGLPSIPSQDILDLAQLLWQQHTQEVTCHITKSSIITFQRLFDGAVLHCESSFVTQLLLPMLRLSSN